MKRCTKCGEWKDESEFYKNTHQSSGLHPSCKPCQRASNKVSRNKHLEERREKQRIYEREHTEEARARQREWRSNNRERRNATERKWVAKNRDSVNARNKVWKHANPDKVLAMTRNRRARLHGCEGKHTSADIISKMGSQRGLCWWCGKPFIDGDSRFKPSVDHIVPTTKGGSNGPENLVIAHLSCNSSKNDKMPWESQFRRLL